MKNILDKITAYKKQEVANQKALYSSQLLEQSIYFNTPIVSLVEFLKRPDMTGVIAEFKRNDIRTSIFMDADLPLIEQAATTGADRIELYTEDFATQYGLGNKKAIEQYIKSAELATKLGLGINAGHDLSLDNIKFFAENIPNLLEVSIGHALIAESLYLGLQNVVNMYIHKLKVCH